MSSDPRRLALVVSLALVATSFAGCAHPLRRFPLETPVMWEDSGDFRVFGPRPDEYYSPFAWDGADQMLFRPLSRVFAVDPARDAINVNAMDEVPDSSWFHNRLGRRDVSPEELATAACEGANLDTTLPAGSWEVVAAKPNGANPGFVIEDPTGQRYLLKFDSLDQPERATTADVLGSILYWGAGYHTPCNRIVFFDRNLLAVREGAMADVGREEVPMTMEMLEPALVRAPRDSDGRLRASASRYLSGRPIGPWRYEGVRQDDPNDVVPHEERRELRGSFVLAAWINHFDSREQNTLATWQSAPDGPEGAGYVQHYFIDWGDSLGSRWGIEGIARRSGYSGYFDLRHVLEDLVSFGTIPRPWHRAHLGPGGEVLGYFHADEFIPDRYRPGYANPAFDRAQERDNAWMTRIVARISPEHLRAALDQGRMLNRDVDGALYEILLERQRRILQRWLTRLSPLTRPVLERNAAGEARVCFDDLAITAGLVEIEARPYWSRAWRHVEGTEVERLERPALVRRRPDQVCATLPDIEGATAEAPAYVIVDVAGLANEQDDDARPVRVHLYQLGRGEYRLVGLERPDHQRAPDGRY